MFFFVFPNFECLHTKGGAAPTASPPPPQYGGQSSQPSQQPTAGGAAYPGVAAARTSRFVAYSKLAHVAALRRRHL